MDIQTSLHNLEFYKRYIQFQQHIENYFQNKQYLKIDLPVLSPALIPESYLKIFETEFTYFDKKEKLYLTPSPELFLKRLLVYGIGNCYYLGKSFRNAEPDSDLHSFEFTILEFYKVNADYMDIAEEVLNMLRFIAEKLKYKKISFSKWEKITVAEAFQKYSHVNEKELFDKKLFIQKAKEKKYKIDGFTYEDIFSQIYVHEIEPHLGKNGFPTLIYDYPRQFAALAKLNPDGKTAQRFEFYIDGIELGDCFSELTDWKEQEDRFNKQKVLHRIDKGFIKALQYGLKDCAGIAIGVERLGLIFTGVKRIQDLKLITIG
jgi:elongation factor P--beta-lysine ligase